MPDIRPGDRLEVHGGQGYRVSRSWGAPVGVGMRGTGADDYGQRGARMGVGMMGGTGWVWAWRAQGG